MIHCDVACPRNRAWQHTCGHARVLRDEWYSREREKYDLEVSLERLVFPASGPGLSRNCITRIIQEGMVKYDLAQLKVRIFLQYVRRQRFVGNASPGGAQGI